jgi:shikimate dehydrogenase
MTLTGKAMLAGITGWPVGHSRSPLLHGTWIIRYGLDAAYVPLPIRAENFAGAIRGLANAGLRGLNVTIPHKEAAFAVCDTVSPRALRAGAVNTLVFRDGRIEGDCTDGFGFLASLGGFDPASGPAVVLGAGGAARAVAAALLDAGCPRVTLVNRTPARAEALAKALAGPIEVRDTPPLEGAALLVNTTSLGMAGQPPLTIDLASLPAHAVVADAVYVPLETPLLAAARARGLRGSDGLGMLLHQARPGFEAWFGIMPEVDEGLRRIVAADIPPR